VPFGGGVSVSQVFVPPHPLIKHWVSVLRNEQTPCAIFSECSSE
jgi:uracil phosphoribosyltransferase